MECQLENQSTYYYMQKPFTNYPFYFALNISISQPEPGVKPLPASRNEEDSTDFTLSMLSKGEILLVEDNLANQKFASFLLSNISFTLNRRICRDRVVVLYQFRQPVPECGEKQVIELKQRSDH